MDITGFIIPFNVVITVTIVMKLYKMNSELKWYSYFNSSLILPDNV